MNTQNKLAIAAKVSALRTKYPSAIAHADNTEVIAPRELPSIIHHMFTGRALEPIFVAAPGIRTIVVPNPSGGVDYQSVEMND